VADDVVRDEMTLDALLGMVRAHSAQLATLQQSTRALESRLALRARLEALLSHELRTPISVILGALQTLHDASVATPPADAPPADRPPADSGPLGDDQRRVLLGRALAQTRYLAEVVEDLLGANPGRGPTFTRAVVRRVRLGDLTDQACMAVSASLPASRVHREIDDDVQVSTAPSRFVAIVVNLLENAAKYGGRHVVELRAGLHDRQLVVEVADRGPGLRGEPVERLFEAFSRGHAVDDVPGHGLGLYLVDRLAGSLGGIVTLEERRGGGVLARVTLPQRRSDDAERAAPAKRALAQPER
jgi:two-component system, sensor histidine kinase LadS